MTIPSGGKVYICAFSASSRKDIGKRFDQFVPSLKESSDPSEAEVSSSRKLRGKHILARFFCFFSFKKNQLRFPESTAGAFSPHHTLPYQAAVNDTVSGLIDRARRCIKISVPDPDGGIQGGECTESRGRVDAETSKGGEY